MRKPRPNRLAKAHKSMISPSSEVTPPTLTCTVRQRKRFEEFAPSERAALAVSGHPEETTSFLVRTRTSEFLTLATILRLRSCGFVTRRRAPAAADVHAGLLPGPVPKGRDRTAGEAGEGGHLPTSPGLALIGFRPRAKNLGFQL